jgi:PadR family transcriptional regulator, regulatory protein PadR
MDLARTLAEQPAHCRLNFMGRRPSGQTLDVLAAFLEDPTKPKYGLELSRSARLPSGTIYPTLARLEQRGWVTSEWEEIDEAKEGRRRRRYYRLTGEGERAARRELRQTLEKIERVLARPALEGGSL